MEDTEKQQLKDIHDFLMKPSVEGRPSRAQQLDDLLSAMRSGKMTIRALLWVAGSLVALGTAWEYLKGFK